MNDKIIKTFEDLKCWQACRELRLFETFEKCPILLKAKEGENFKHRNTLSILRIKI
jgi:hypothetical protein